MKQVSEELYATLFGKCADCKQDYINDCCPVRQKLAFAGYSGNKCPSCAHLEEKPHLIDKLNSKPYCKTDCPQYIKCMTLGVT